MNPMIPILPNEVHGHRDRLAEIYVQTEVPPANLLLGNPLAIYLLTRRAASLGSTRRLVQLIMEVVADGPVNPFEFHWWKLTYEHAVAVKAALVSRP